MSQNAEYIIMRYIEIRPELWGRGRVVKQGQWHGSLRKDLSQADPHGRPSLLINQAGMVVVRCCMCQSLPHKAFLFSPSKMVDRVLVDTL